MEYEPHRVSAPIRHEAPWSRDNHLGNSIHNPGYPNYFNWTIPDINRQHCVIRARYNISTADYYAWEGAVNSSNNRPSGQDFAELDIWTALGLSREDAVEVRAHRLVVRVLRCVGNGGFVHWGEERGGEYLVFEYS